MPAHDPLAAFIDGAVFGPMRRPMPLKETRIEVRILGGLALVSATRRFFNAERESIEATITFPVPVHATLTGLTALIGGRLLTATAQPRAGAREQYEAAIDSGKTAVLHEEALRGVHILSVGHIPPGTEVAVISRWAMPLALIGDRPGLRIPATVGQIYGRSPLPDSDDLVTGPVRHEAVLSVVSDSGVPLLAGRPIPEETRLLLDQAIDITIDNWVQRSIEGVSADGRRVTLTIAPAPAGEAAIDVELLADNSGSMMEAAERGVTKHQAMLSGLHAADELLRPGDRLRLWSFANSATAIGLAARPGELGPVLRHFPEPNGGTEIGGALAMAVASGAASDILLLTDGQSHALDVQTLARSGRRFSVVLIGAGSLEADVGHLAALSGGELFVASGRETGTALQSALRSLRSARLPAPAIDGPLDTVSVRRGGMLIEARWSEERAAIADEAARAIGAIALALALPRLEPARATELAVAHGIVCHLTSLVLVDEAGERQEGLPAMRKVPLMAAPAGMARAAMAAPPPVMAAPMPAPAPPQSSLRQRVTSFFRSSPPPVDLVDRIDWADNPEALRRGALDQLPPLAAAAIERASRLVEIVALARAVGASPIVTVLALLAMARAGDRAAERFARAVLGHADPTIVETARRAIGL